MIWLLLWMYVWGFFLSGFTLHLHAGRSPNYTEMWLRIGLNASWPVGWPCVLLLALGMNVWDEIQYKRRSKA